jgi:hypothetical protein
MIASTEYLKQSVYFSWIRVFCPHDKDAKTTKLIFTKFCKVDQYEMLSINFGLSFSFVYSVIYMKNSSDIYSQTTKRMVIYYLLLQLNMLQLHSYSNYWKTNYLRGLRNYKTRKSRSCKLIFSTRAHQKSFFLACGTDPEAIQSVPGGMCQTSGGCSLC